MHTHAVLLTKISHSITAKFMKLQKSKRDHHK